MRDLAVALVHHPVLDAKGAASTSTLTTIDIHDLSRSCRTYGASLYLVHPIPAQKELARRVIDHWTHGSSSKRIPDRKDALDITKIVSTLDEAKEGREVWVTAARALERPILEWKDARARLAAEGPPVLLVFGTSWGLAPSVVTSAAELLAPIHGVGDWNHLSVRAACAIALDRLRG